MGSIAFSYRSESRFSSKTKKKKRSKIKLNLKPKMCYLLSFATRRVRQMPRNQIHTGKKYTVRLYLPYYILPQLRNMQTSTANQRPLHNIRKYYNIILYTISGAETCIYNDIIYFCFTSETCRAFRTDDLFFFFLSFSEYYYILLHTGTIITVDRCPPRVHIYYISRCIYISGVPAAQTT